MERKLVLSLIACAGLSFASATLALADDPAPDTFFDNIDRHVLNVDTAAGP